MTTVSVLRLLGLLLSVPAVSPALADTTALYAAPGDVLTMKVEIASDGSLRGEMGGALAAKSGASEGSVGLIVRNGENFMLQLAPDGKHVVLHMADLAAIMHDAMAERLKAMPPIPQDAFGLEEKGTAKVGDRVGRAFFFKGNSTNPVAFVSDDPDLAELAVAMRRQFHASSEMAATIGGPVPTEMTREMEAALAKGAPLRFGGMDLKTVDHKTIPTSRFELPAQPLSREEIKNMMTRQP